MITALVQFRLPQPVTREQARELFLGTAPRYRDMAGLIRKYYLLSEDGCTAGGAYLWADRESAERVYDDNWRATVAQRYGAQPSVTWFDTPVVVDNLEARIITDSA